MSDLDKGIIFFDCDETLWTSLDKDRIGSQDKNDVFEKIDKFNIKRLSDGKIFTLKSDVLDLLITLKKLGYALGIVSDNNEKTVLEALFIFSIIDFFDPNLVSISLRDGYCPKDKMIDEILDKNNITNRDHIILVDDKDYGLAMTKKGYQFIQAEGNSLLENCKNIINSSSD